MKKIVFLILMLSLAGCGAYPLSEIQIKKAYQICENNDGLAWVVPKTRPFQFTGDTEFIGVLCKNGAAFRIRGTKVKHN